jgi:hypothetical protein
LQGKKIIHLKLCVFAFSLPPVNVEWTVIQYPLKLIHPSCKPIYSHAAFVMRYANNGQVIAANHYTTDAVKDFFQTYNKYWWII